MLKRPVNAQPQLPGYHIRELGSSHEIERVANMINRAERPVFYVGQGVILSEAHELLRQCADQANIPVTTTLHGLGAFDEHSPLSLHMLGMHGAAYANWAVRDADCVIAVGARFDDRITGDPKAFAPGARAAERALRALNETLEPLTSFILPGGGEAAARIHLARAIVRRAERDMVALHREEPINPAALQYINRLSDYLFTLARAINAGGSGDVLWVPGANR